MGTLRGKTPAIVRKEIWARILAYNLVRNIITQSARLFERQPREYSFKLALRMIESFRLLGLLYEDKEKLYNCLLTAIASKIVGNRPGRHEPRRLKRRASNYSLLVRPRHHYHKKVKNC